MNLVVYTNKMNIIDFIKTKFSNLKNINEKVIKNPPLFTGSNLYHVKIQNNDYKNYTYIIIPVTIINNFYETIKFYRSISKFN